MLECEAYQYGIEGAGHTWELFRPCLNKKPRTAPLVGDANLRQTEVNPDHGRAVSRDATSNLSLAAPHVQNALRPAQVVFY